MAKQNIYNSVEGVLFGLDQYDEMKSMCEEVKIQKAKSDKMSFTSN